MWAELLVELIVQIFVEIFIGSIIKSSEYLWRLVSGDSVSHSGCSLIHT
jgi:hypothetical protein